MSGVTQADRSNPSHLYDYDLVYKMIIVGDSGVGKSSLLLRYTEGFFQDSYISTIGVDFRIRTVDIEGKRVKLNIWDTAGQDRFKTLCTQYYRGAHAVAIVFDVTDVESFENVTKWHREVTMACSPLCSIFLIGNKSDHASLRTVSHHQAQELADAMSLPYIEASAKADSNVTEMFMSMARETFEKNGGRFADTKQTDVLNLNYRSHSKAEKRSYFRCLDCSIM